MLEAIVVRALEEDGDDIEAAIDSGGGVLEQVALGDPPDLPLFARSHGFLGPAVRFVRTGFDLDEDQGRPVPRDDIDLSAEHPETAGEDLVFLSFEIAAGDVLAGTS